MRQLMRYDDFASMGACNQIISQSRHSLMFHSAIGGHCDYCIAIFFKGIGSELRFKELDDVRQSGKINQSVVVLRLSDEILDRQVAVGLVDFYIRTGGNADQIRRHGIAAQPVMGFGAVAVIHDAFSQTVAGNQPVTSHRDVQIHNRFVPRVVVTGPPVTTGVGV